MNDIALVLCSFNKKEYTLNCIESIFKSSIHNFDLIVVDNASTDGVSGEIKKRYPDKIHLITSTVNNGAGAGFNIGIKYALSKEYRYIMTVDHDILFMEDTIEILYNFLNEHEDVAAAGSKFCYMDRPDTVQWLGSFMDYENFRQYDEFSNCKDDEKIPDIYYCDSIILGGMMVRKTALEKIGLLDERFFIYEEDYDWCLRFKKAGYKIVACGRAKVLHKFGLSEAMKSSTFGTYYYRRNKFRLFALRLPDHLIEEYCNHVLSDIFQGLYSCNYQKKYNTMKSLFMSLDDGLNGITGRAGEGRIFEVDRVENRLKLLLKGITQVILKIDDLTENKLTATRKIITGIIQYNKDVKISIDTNDETIIYQINNVNFINAGNIAQDETYLKLNLCNHIFHTEYFETGGIYIDSYLNIVADDKDRQYCRNYSQSYEFFYNTFYPSMVLKVNQLKMELVGERY